MGGETYNNVWMSYPLDIPEMQITGSNIFNDLAIDEGASISFEENSTQVVSSFTALGTIDKPISINTITQEGHFTLSKASGVVICDYLILAHVHVTGGAIWITRHSINYQDNEGWRFYIMNTTYLQHDGTTLNLYFNSSIVESWGFSEKINYLDILPDQDNTIVMGSAAKRFKEGHFVNIPTKTEADETYQPIDPDLTAIAALEGTSGVLTKTAENTWVLDDTPPIAEETDPIFLASEAASFVAGDKEKLNNIEANAEVNNISDANATDLTDGGETGLHTHPYLAVPSILNKTDDYELDPTDVYKTVTMDSIAAKTLTIPSGLTTGVYFEFVKLGAGRLTIQMSGSEIVADSTAGGTVYDTEATDIITKIRMQKITSTKWTLELLTEGKWTTT